MRRVFAVIGLLVMATTAAAQTGSQMMDKVIASLDAKKDAYAQVAHQIWSFAEVGYQETKSSALLQSQLRSAGFDVKSGVAEIPTAFIASWGSGKPIIGIVGEFDALPGLSQQAVPERDAIKAGDPGHGW